MEYNKNQSGSDSVKLPFKSEAAFVRKFRGYLDMCSGIDCGEGKPIKRIANTAGFCAWCGITSAEFGLCRVRYPRAFDIMQSHLIDEAVNNKLLNSGPMMDYLLNSVNTFGGDGSAVSFECEQDFGEDSQ